MDTCVSIAQKLGMQDMVVCGAHQLVEEDNLSYECNSLQKYGC